MDMKEVRTALGEVQQSLVRVTTLQQDMAEKQQEMAARQQEMAARQQEMAAKQQETAQATADLTRRFETFLIRFDETLEMLVTHDTEQLQRVTAVERENAALRQVVEQLTSRVETVERRLAS